MTKLSTAQHPELDVADLVTALVKLSAEERINVLVMASHEIGTSYLREALEVISPTVLPRHEYSPPQTVLLSDGYYPPDESGKVSEK